MGCQLSKMARQVTQKAFFVVRYQRSGSPFVHRGLRRLPPCYWPEALFGNGTLQGVVLEYWPRADAGWLGTYGHRVWQTPRLYLSTDEATLGRFWRTRLVVAEFVSLHTHAHDLALVDVQALRFGRIEQFVG